MGDGKPKKGGPSRVAMCQGKKAFTSASLAHKVCRRRNRSRKLWDDKYEFQNVYRCPHCGKWHIGRANAL